MVVENYPSSYIKQSTSTTIPTTQIVEEPVSSSQASSSSRVGEKVSYRTQSEKNKLIKELRQQGLDLDPRYDKVVPKGYYYTNTGKLRREGSKYDVELVQTSTGTEILQRGKVPKSVVAPKVASYIQSSSQQTEQDIVYTSSGLGTSKASSLQSSAEKQSTAQYTSTLISTREGIKQVGGQNGKQNNIQTTYTTNTNSNSGGLSSSNNLYSGYNSRSTPTVSRSISSQETQYVPNQAVFNYEFKPISLGQEAIKQYKQGDIIGIASGTSLGLLSVGIGTGKAVVGSIEFFSPYSFTQKKFQVPIYTPLKETVQSVKSGELFRYIQREPFEFGGTIIGGFASANIVPKTIKTQYIKYGATAIPEEQVFSSQVLTEGKKFPLATSTEQALNRFNTPDSQGNIIVSTASPSKIKGTETGMGLRATLGLEDPGIYTTPKGEGSPRFLGISGESGYKFTLNPVKPIKEFFSTPTVTEFQVRGVLRQPREVVSQPGFTATKLFFETEGSKTGFAYLTKRSEIGQGELKPQLYPSSSKEPFVLDGKLIREGDLILERGTPELESVVPFKSKLKYETPKTFLGRLKGFEEYTTYKGEVVPIRKAKVLGETGEGISLGELSTVEEAYAESSSALSRSRSVTPTSSLKYSITPSESSISSVSSNISKVSSSSISSSTESIISPTSSFKSSISSISSTSITGTSESKLNTPSSSITNIPSSSLSSISETPSRPSYKPPTDIPKYTIPPNVQSEFKGFETPKKKKKRVELFVKRKGKFELKGVGEDTGLLFKKGFDITRGTASASFKVVEEGGQKISPNVLPTGFTKSKRDEGVIVQKREFRIGTAGEKFEITRKGIQANRDKRRLI